LLPPLLCWLELALPTVEEPEFVDAVAVGAAPAELAVVEPDAAAELAVVELDVPDPVVLDDWAGVGWVELELVWVPPADVLLAWAVACSAA